MVEDNAAPPDPEISPEEKTAPSSSLPVTERRVVGDYVVGRKIGEGGMGVVFEAEQPRLRRTVALKVVRGGRFVDGHSLRLFEREAHALARLEHSGIAAIYEAGSTEEGEHFFAMELVRGEPLSHYLRSTAGDGPPAPPEIGNRLALFLKICDAVNYAHQRGVIHRDLKPSNIMVVGDRGVASVDEPSTDGAIVKVLDFGLARITDGDGAAVTAMTQMGEVQGTLSYMSPEQARGNPDEIDLRTDVYSLGVLLYKLVTGRLPHRLSDMSALEAMRIVIEEDPTPPDRAWNDTDGTRQKLDRELGTIILKALEKEPSRRYQNVLALAEDVERYLNNEPILAVPTSVAYQLRKMVVRHKGPFAAVVVVFVLLAAFAVTVSFQSARIARERTAAVQARGEAELRRGQAEDLIGFMIGDLRDKLDPLGRLDILDDVGDQALEYFASLNANDLSADDLFRLSTTLHQIGQVRYDQGDRPAALEAFERSLALAENLAQRDPDNVQWQKGLGESHFWVGFVSWERGDLEAALGPFRSYLEIAQDVAAGDPGDADLQLEVAYAHNNIGFVLRETGDLDGALQRFRGVAAIMEELAAADPDNGGLKFELANAHNTVGSVLAVQGVLHEASEQYRIDLGMKRELVQLDPANTEWQESLSISHNLLAGILAPLDDIEEALTHYQAAVDLMDTLVVRDRANTRWRRELAVDNSSAGRQLRALGDVDASLSSLRVAVTIMDELVAEDPADSGWRRDLAELRISLGVTLGMRGAWDQALDEGRAALQILEGVLQDSPADRSARRFQADGYILLGTVFAAMGDDEQAPAAWREALAISEPEARESTDYRFLLPWARSLLYLERVAEAEPIVERLVDMGYRNRVFLSLCKSKGLRMN